MNLVELLKPPGTEIHSGPAVESSRLQLTQYGVTGPNMPCYQIRMNSPIACLQYVRRGSGILIINEEMYQARAGDTFLLREGMNQIYYSNPDNQFERVWINFRGELPRALIRLYGLEDFVVFRNTDSEPLLREIFSLCEAGLPAPDYQEQLEHRLLSIAQLLAAHREEPPGADTSVEEIRLYIDHHITENLQLSQIAEAFSYSREHIVRLFRKNYGITPHQYLIQSKIRLAMNMLMENKKSIEEISDFLNFSAPQHFSSTFLRFTGYRPSAYRKRRLD